jgi:hypothetical protein
MPANMPIIFNRGQLAYDAERKILAIGGDSKVTLYKVTYSPTTPTLEYWTSTSTIGNIDGVAFGRQFLTDENFLTKVKAGDIEGIINAIKLIQREGKDAYSINCANYVKQNFEKENLLNETLSVYGES